MKLPLRFLTLFCLTAKILALEAAPDQTSCLSSPTINALMDPQPQRTGGKGIYFSNAQVTAIRTDHYKPIRTYSSTSGARAKQGITYEELYDLRKDAAEMENLATQSAFATVKVELTRRLEAEKAAMAATPDP